MSAIRFSHSWHSYSPSPHALLSRLLSSPPFLSLSSNPPSPSLSLSPFPPSLSHQVLPLEIASKYSHFGSPPLGPSDFEAKPMVLILGQYSVGKTSFIRSLVK